jgi:lipopolysaccharide/colanic/teichoic acid biosynthesis glycosyltransferase
LGHALQGAAFDKLPHLINLLRRNVTLVGPRCSKTPRGAALRHQVPLHRVHNMRPGLVSWADVREHKEGSGVAFDDDCYYLANRSLIFDLKILFLAVISQDTYS